MSIYLKIAIILFAVIGSLTKAYKLYILRKDINADLILTKYKGNKKDPENSEEYRLYLAYKQLPKNTFKMKKLRIRYIFQDDMFEKIIDFIAKIMLPILLFIITLIYTVFIAFISFINSEMARMDKSDEENDVETSVELDEDYLERIENTLSTFSSFSQDLPNTLTFLAILLPIYFTIHLIIAHNKKELLHKHTAVINEVEKDRS